MRASPLVWLVLAAAPSAFQATPVLTPSEVRGRELFMRGLDADGSTPVARLGDGRTPVPASALPCASCHGFDGRGRPEGGVAPSDLTWTALTKPYGTTLPSGRKHPPYDERTLRRAITQGVDAGGARLATTMPLYELTHEQADDLVAYVRRLEELRDPGIAPSTLRLGCLLPPHGGEAVEELLRSFFDEISEEGGIHGRRVDLRFRRPGPAHAERLSAVLALIEDDGCFALIASDLRGIEERAGELARRTGTPVLGALSMGPAERRPPDRYLFHLLAGLHLQCAALVQHAAALFEGAAPRAWIVADDERADAGADIAERWNALGGEPAVLLPTSSDAGLPVAEGSQPPRVIFLLVARPAEQGALLAPLRARVPGAPVLLPGVLASPTIEAQALGGTTDLWISLPRGPRDQDAKAVAAFREFARSHELGSVSTAEQVTAWAGAQLVAEALRRAGRDLGREKLVATLESLYQFETGLLPPITFGPNRHVGTAGAWILRISAEHGFDARGRWVAVE